MESWNQNVRKKCVFHWIGPLSRYGLVVAKSVHGGLTEWLCPLPTRFSQGSKGGPREAKLSPTVASVPWRGWGGGINFFFGKKKGYPLLFWRHRNKNIGATIRLAWEIWLILPLKSDGHPIFSITQFTHVSRHFETKSRKGKTSLKKKTFLIT